METTETKSTKTRTRAELVARYRELARSMHEHLSDSDWNALKRERDQVQVEIDRLDGKA